MNFSPKFSIKTLMLHASRRTLGFARVSFLSGMSSLQVAA